MHLAKTVEGQEFVPKTHILYYALQQLHAIGPLVPFLLLFLAAVQQQQQQGLPQKRKVGLN